MWRKAVRPVAQAVPGTPYFIHCWGNQRIYPEGDLGAGGILSYTIKYSRKVKIKQKRKNSETRSSKHI